MPSILTDKNMKRWK